MLISYSLEEQSLRTYSACSPHAKSLSRRQRNKWVDAIRSAMKEPIYYPSTVSTTSTDSSDSFDVLRDRDQRLQRSVHNTADTAPRPGADWRRVNTSPAGQFKITHRASVSSIPSSAHALEQQKRKSQEMVINRTFLLFFLRSNKQFRRLYFTLSIVFSITFMHVSYQAEIVLEHIMFFFF